MYGQEIRQGASSNLKNARKSSRLVFTYKKLFPLPSVTGLTIQ